MKQKSRSKFLVGVDEAGRGPLAGPVAVGAVIVKNSAKGMPAILNEGRDSKQLSPNERERIYKLIKEAQKKNEINFSVTLVGASTIDRYGIVFAIRKALASCLEKIGALPHETEVLLDGALKAPSHFVLQKTIIKGDASVPLIGLASICAKVVRDKYMSRLGRVDSRYGFEIHKGYGTRAHSQAIRRFGPSAEHRRSFLKSFL